MASKIQKARPLIIKYFEQRAALGQRTYSLADLAEILERHRTAWELKKAFFRAEFVDFLQEKCSLRPLIFEGQDFESRTRYAWGDTSELEAALSFGNGCHLSHATAVFMHRLTEQIPRRIYINHEQSPKPEPSVKLTQESITLAFKGEARRTREIYQLGEREVVVLAGKHTGDFEVGEVESPEGQFLRCTKLERTLIDITVRPVYGGGIYQVLKAFESAKDRMAVTVLVATLKTLNFIYPYHQAVGFLMERAGYEESRTRRLHGMGLNYDFYLTHGMGVDIEYNAKWRLFHPIGF